MLRSVLEEFLVRESAASALLLAEEFMRLREKVRKEEVGEVLSRH